MTLALCVRGQIELRSELIADFAWRDSKGVSHVPSKMDTNHLFNTLKMIWNNSVPAPYRVGEKVRLYDFGEFYSDEYMRRAIYALGRELTTRSLYAGQMALLLQMYEYFKRVPTLLQRDGR